MFRIHLAPRICAALLASGLMAVYSDMSGLPGAAQTTPKPTPGKAAPQPAKVPVPQTGAGSRSPLPEGKDGLESDESDRSESTGITTLHNWVYTRADTVMSGATARYDKNKDTLDTDDPVVMDDKKHHLTADRAHIEHAQNEPSLREVTLTGHAVMVLKPEEKAQDVPPAPVNVPGATEPGKLKVVSIHQDANQVNQSNKQDPAAPAQRETPAGAKPDKDREDAKDQQRHGGTVTCDKIEYHTRKKYAVLTGHVVFKQSFVDKDGKHIERTGTCEHAENDGKAEVLHLFKPVHFDSSDGQIFDSPDDVLVGTKDHDEWIKVKKSHILFNTPENDDDNDAPAGGKDSNGKSGAAAKDKSKSGP